MKRTLLFLIALIAEKGIKIQKNNQVLTFNQSNYEKAIYDFIISYSANLYC